MASQTTVDAQITDAITARQAQITQLQADVDVLQQAARALAGKSADPGTRRKAASRPKATPQPTPKRRPMTAAQRAAVGKRMKASWAKRRK